MKRVYPLENKPFPSITHSFEHKGFYIEISFTIFGGRRITAREIGSEDYLFNWCAGNLMEHAEILVGLAKEVIEQDLPCYPFQSRVKPYFKCEHFMRFLKSVNFQPFKIE